MSTDAYSRCSDISLTCHRIANIIYRGLTVKIDRYCSEQSDQTVSVQRLPRTIPCHLMRFQIEGINVRQLVTSVTATRTAANIYDVVCEIENGPSHRITHRLPSGARPTPFSASQLGEKIGDFVLGELDRPTQVQRCQEVPPAMVA